MIAIVRKNMPVLSPELRVQLFGANSRFYEAFRSASKGAAAGNSLLEQAKVNDALKADMKIIEQPQSLCSLI